MDPITSSSPVGGPSIDQRRTQLLGLLYEASVAIDSLWQASLRAGASEAIAVAEASHAIHKALISITPLEQSTPRPHTKEGGSAARAPIVDRRS
jgi:hypothetical protein